MSFRFERETNNSPPRNPELPVKKIFINKICTECVSNYNLVFSNNFYSDNSNPKIPSTIRPILINFIVDTGSLNQIMPMIAMSAVPKLAQMAYATLTFIFSSTNTRQTRHNR